jgi:hypothetical protein
MNPVNYLFSEEDKDFQVNKSDSNHERWAMTALVLRWMRAVTGKYLK